MNLLSMGNAVLSMGIYMLIGYLVSRKIRLQQNTKDFMVTLIVYVAFPCLILSSFSKLTIEKELFTELLIVFFFSVLLYLFTLFFGLIVTRMFRGSKQKAKEIAVISAHANTGYIGIPLCSLFGPKVVLLAVIYDVGIGVSLWIFSMLILQKRFSFDLQIIRKIINLPLITILLGFLFNLLHLQLPPNLLQLTDRLGLLASPLAMIYIGSFIPQLINKKQQAKPIWLSIALGIRLLLIPLLIAMILRQLQLGVDVAQVILTMSMMPVGAMVPIIFAMNNADEEFGASATVYSTLISLVTIPVMMTICWHLVGIK